MKNIVIAAGYATRLGALTANFPKPLLKIGEKSILERMLDDIDRIPEIDEHVIVTNHKFAHHFEEWKAQMHYSKPITVIDDGTSTNETRLGAVRDLQYAIQQTGLNDDMLVVAADNLLFFSFQAFVDFYKQKGTPCIMCHEQPELAKLQRTGVVVLDADSKVLNMEEKPQQPKSTWAVPPFYIYKKENIDTIMHAIEHGCGFDAPGNLAHYMCDVTTVHAWKMRRTLSISPCLGGGTEAAVSREQKSSLGGETLLRFDIGSLDTYYQACELFGKDKTL